jgi:hypothetical protein
MEVVASTGTLRERLAGATRENGGTSDYLRDNGSRLPFDQHEIELAGGVKLARSATGGLTLRSGRLREILAEAEVDARIKLKNNPPTEGSDV